MTVQSSSSAVSGTIAAGAAPVFPSGLSAALAKPIEPFLIDGFAAAKLVDLERFFMTTPKQVRDNLATVDNIWRLEGFEPTPDVTKYDEAIIRGEMTTQEAIERVLEEVKRNNAKPSV